MTGDAAVAFFDQTLLTPRVTVAGVEESPLIDRVVSANTFSTHHIAPGRRASLDFLGRRWSRLFSKPTLTVLNHYHQCGGVVSQDVCGQFHGKIVRSTSRESKKTPRAESAGIITQSSEAG